MPQPIDILVGRRIRQRRWLLGMSQQDLAAEIGIQFQQVQKYETAMNRVSASRLWGIAAALPTTPGYFFLHENQPGEVAQDQKDALRKEFRQFLCIYAQIPQGQRRALVDLARSLAA